MKIRNQNQWERKFMEACREGKIEDLRHLCQKQYLDCGWADIHGEGEQGFRIACEQGHLEVVKYLLTSPELRESGHRFADVHAYDDWGFCWACHYKQWDLLRWLILDYGIKKTRPIERTTKFFPHVQEYFRVREELKDIQQTLQSPSLSNTPHDERTFKKTKKL